MKAILKYPGGKAKEIKYFIDLFPKEYNIYYEPFLGGASVYFHLKPRKAVLNDLNKKLMNFYLTVKNRYTQLESELRLIADTFKNYSEDDRKKFYYLMRDVYNNKISSDFLPASVYYVINKLAYNGLSRVNSKMEFNVPFNHSKSLSISLTEEHSILFQNAVLYSKDYSEIFTMAKPDDFMFLDPPYDSVFNNYANNNIDNSKEFHEKLAEDFKNLKCKALMIIGKTDLIYDLYKDYIYDEYDKQYAINIKNRFKSETKHLIIKNYEINNGIKVFVPDNTVTVNELFSGIGAQRKALERAGIPYKIVGISDIDKYANQSYEAIFGETYQYGDISKAERLNYADLWTYSFPCFTGDTYVLTKEGLKYIKDVVEGDLVLTHKNRYKKVLKVSETGIKPIWKIKGTGIDEIRCTENHRFYVRKKHRKWDKDTKKYIRVFDNPEWVECKNLSKDYYLGVAINQEANLPNWNGIDFIWADNRKTRHKNQISDLLTNNSFWWLVGRYVGDGWQRYEQGVIICCNKNKKDDMIFHLNKCSLNYSLVEERTTYKFHISLKEVQLFLNSFGVGAINKKIPSFVFDLPINLTDSFIEGYFHADGWYNKRNNEYRITSISRELVYGIAQLVAKVYKCPYRLYYTKRPSICVIEGRTCNQHDTYTLIWKKDRRKQDKSFYESGYVWFPVTSVEDNMSMETVYDLSVDEDHSFMANGVIAHNCQDISVAGKQEGLTKNTRSGLLYEVQRLLETAKAEGTLPKYLLLENVKNLTGKKFRPQFEDWLSWLNDLGYDNYWEVLNAKDYGIPQNRERVFGVSIRKDLNQTFKFPEKEDLRLCLKDLLESDVDEKYYLSDDKVEKLFTSMDEKIVSNTVRVGGRGSVDRHTWDLVQVNEPVIGASRGRNPENPSDRTVGAPTEQRLEINETGCSNTLTTVQKDNLVVEKRQEDYSIYQLPRGNNSGGIKNIVPTITTSFYEHNNLLVEKNFYKAKNSGVSNTQLYRQAGNSIVVNVLEKIFINLFEEKEPFRVVRGKETLLMNYYDNDCTIPSEQI